MGAGQMLALTRKVCMCMHTHACLHPRAAWCVFAIRLRVRASALVRCFSFPSQEMGAVVGSLQTAVSLLLSFYALQRIAWFWSVLMEGVQLGGRAHDLAMIAGACPPKGEEDWKAWGGPSLVSGRSAHRAKGSELGVVLK